MSAEMIGAIESGEYNVESAYRVERAIHEPFKDPDSRITSLRKVILIGFELNVI